MEFVISVETRLAGKTLEVCRVASVERSGSGIGLSGRFERKPAIGV
jgi:hypothetical protein